MELDVLLAAAKLGDPRANPLRCAPGRLSLTVDLVPA
jgi:hypothetical protein